MSSLRQFTRSSRSPATTAGLAPGPTSSSNTARTSTSPSSIRLPNINNNSSSPASSRPTAARSPNPPPAGNRRTVSPQNVSARSRSPQQQQQSMMMASARNNQNRRSSPMTGRISPRNQSYNQQRSQMSSTGMGRSLGATGSLRGGADSRMKQEAMMKKAQKKMREVMKLEIKLRQDADQERTEFVEQVSRRFDQERESVIFKTINRLNGEVSSLKRQLHTTEQTWRMRWRKVVGDEFGKFSDMLIAENLIDAETTPAGSMAALAHANDGNGTNYEEIAAKLAEFTKDTYERSQNLKRDILNQQVRGDDLQGTLENRTSELAAADRLIRTHLVGRGSEHTIAVELFRKQGAEFEKRFENLEKEFRARVEDLLQDSASIEMVGSHNAEDALMAKVKENRSLLYNNNSNTSATSNNNNSNNARLSMTEENAKKVESSKNWRPSGKNYVDILETFITSMECQKILQVQLLREVQLAMIDLSKKHFQNITSEIRKNRSNLPASVRNKLFDEKSIARDDLIEMLDLLSFEPRVAEMIMGRFPPTELQDAAPELERFIESHGGIYDEQLQQQQQSQNQNQQQQNKMRGLGGTSSSLGSTKLSNISVDGGDSRSAGVDLSDVERERFLRRTLATTNVQKNHFVGNPNLMAFGGNQNQAMMNNVNPKRVQLPRKPFEVYSSRLVYSTKSGFSDIGSDQQQQQQSNGNHVTTNDQGELM